MNQEKAIYGVQPVLEAIKAESKIERVLLARSEGPQTRRVREAAISAGLKVVEVKKDELDRRVGGARHQGVLAVLDTNEIDTVDVDAILAKAAAANEPPLVLLLDNIQDPQNLGAILRSAHALGAHGVVIPKMRAAQITGAVVRASAGAALHVPVATVTNLKHALDALREAEVWTAAAVMDGEPAHKARLDGPLALVIGGEAKGVRPSVAAACDLRIGIPISHGFDSLNASVAAGILLYEAVRQRLLQGEAAQRATRA